MQKTWFITGTSRGLGLEIAKAALRAGDRVVATAREPSAIAAALGPDSENLLLMTLDVTNAVAAQTAVNAALLRFGAIDVLVNNAGYGHLGFFEESTPAEIEAQFATNLFGVFNVTRAALPAMRAARNGRMFNVSSLAGIRGAEFASLYCASKFALEGFSESLAQEVAQFGLSVTIVEPGPFRTDFLTPASIRFGDGGLPDYANRRAELRSSFEQRNGNQPGDPQKLAEAMVTLANNTNPPMRFIAGSVAVNAADAKLAGMQAELNHWRVRGVAADYS